MQQHQKFLQTEGKIKDAIVQLIREKGLVNITVSDIVSQAKINRTTFYRHYLDKHDLIEQYRNTILNDFKNLAQEYLNSTFVWQDPYSTKMQGNNLLKQVANNFTANHNFYRAWFSSKGDQQTVIATSKLINDVITERLDRLSHDHRITPIIPVDYARKIIIAGLWIIVKTWLAQEEAITADELYNILLRTRYLSPFELVGLRKGK